MKPTMGSPEVPRKKPHTNTRPARPGCGLAVVRGARSSRQRRRFDHPNGCWPRRSHDAEGASATAASRGDLTLQNRLAGSKRWQRQFGLGWRLVYFWRGRDRDAEGSHGLGWLGGRNKGVARGFLRMRFNLMTLGGRFGASAAFSEW